MFLDTTHFVHFVSCHIHQAVIYIKSIIRHYLIIEVTNPKVCKKDCMQKSSWSGKRHDIIMLWMVYRDGAIGDGASLLTSRLEPAKSEDPPPPPGGWHP